MDFTLKTFKDFHKILIRWTEAARLNKSKTKISNSICGAAIFKNPQLKDSSLQYSSLFTVQSLCRPVSKTKKF